MKHTEIRKIFFDYFVKQNHHKVFSAPLVPAKDPTILFTNAGMNQFKSVFLNEEKREYNKAVSIQKCMRVSGKHNDFDEVGKSSFHHTFFEMLGNFSFGDYFKEKAIEYGWELLTEYYKFKPEQLWITVFENDDEAFRIWEEKIGVPSHKIIRLGEKSNFWQMGETGPCGPCSEIHFDRGKDFGPEAFDEDNKRYVEVWNLVFMQYSRDKSGSLQLLPSPSIDTGMGMERLTALIQGKNSNYQTDLFQPLIEYTAELGGIDPKTPDNNHQIALNVVADHIRSLSFLISDGVLPANDGRGYVLRRILRRAAKHGKSLGFQNPFLYKVSHKAIEIMKDFYPELEYHQDFISEVVKAEEDRFNNTLLNGLKRFEELLFQASESSEQLIPGDQLFKLSDTYGFPLDFARDLAIEKDIDIDYSGFKKHLDRQREKSRLHLEKQRTNSQTLKNIEKYTSTFTGYSEIEQESKVLAIYVNGESVNSLNEKQEGIVVFDKTPFYAESGGQVGDQGSGKNDLTFFQIKDTQKALNGVSTLQAILHQVQIMKGALKPGDEVNLMVDTVRRQRTAIHHTATHLLHAALREVLGLHVKQAGSYVGPDKLRFDFTHFKALTNIELEKIEGMVNEKIRENLPVSANTLKYEVAINQGAIAIFNEKYSDIVRVLQMGSFSKELCGGTHLKATGEIGIFKIIGESSISSGIRRIEALAGEQGFKYIQKKLDIMNQVISYFKQPQEQILDFLITQDKNLKEKEKQLKRINQKKDTERVNVKKIISESQKINNIATVIEFVDQLDRKQLSTLADEIKQKTEGIAILLTHLDGKSAIVASIAKSHTKSLHAGTIIKEIAKLINGNGGGRPDFAQAGGDPIEDFLKFKLQIADIIKKYFA